MLLLPLIIMQLVVPLCGMPIMPVGEFENESCDCPPVLMPIMPIGQHKEELCLCAPYGSGVTIKIRSESRKKSISEYQIAPKDTKKFEVVNGANDSKNLTNVGEPRLEKNINVIISNSSNSSITTIKQLESVRNNKSVSTTQPSTQSQNKKERRQDSTDLHICSKLGLTYIILYSDDSCKQHKSKFDITNAIDFNLYSADSPDKNSDKSSTISFEQRFTSNRTIISKYPRDVYVRDILDGVDTLRAGYGGKCSFGIRTNMCYSVPMRPDSIQKNMGNGCRVEENGVISYKLVNYESYESFRIESTKKFKPSEDTIEQVFTPTSQWSNTGGCFDSFEKNNR